MGARQKTVGGRMKTKRRAWTPAEDDIMRAKYPTHSAHELAPLLARQPKAIGNGQVSRVAAAAFAMLHGKLLTRS